MTNKQHASLQNALELLYNHTRSKQALFPLLNPLFLFYCYMILPVPQRHHLSPSGPEIAQINQAQIRPGWITDRLLAMTSQPCCHRQGWMWGVDLPESPNPGLITSVEQAHLPAP